MAINNKTNTLYYLFVSVLLLQQANLLSSTLELDDLHEHVFGEELPNILWVWLDNPDRVQTREELRRKHLSIEEFII